METKKPKPSWIQDIHGFTTSRGFLPHLESPGSVYFTTSCTFRKLVLSNDEKDLVMNAIKFHDGTKYELEAAVIMPDHFHLIFSPLLKNDTAYYGLREIFHSLKSFTSNLISKSRKNSGSHVLSSRIWQEENFDHIIRNEKDYLEKLNYILYNPVVAELVEKPLQYRWLWYKGISRE